MIILLSPAKTLDYDASVGNVPFTVPSLLPKSKQLIKILKSKNPSEISQLMRLSDKLSLLNTNRYQSWKGQKKISKTSKQSAFVFKGDVYQGLKVEELSKKELDFCQKHLRLLSGLYGVLRPLDVIEPYRLEMGTKLESEQGKNLYDFWGCAISEEIIKELNDMGSDLLINLASKEYFNSIKLLPKKIKVISPIFKDHSKGNYKIISFYAKKARGLMASWIIRNKITKAEDLNDFSEEGYFFSRRDSAEYTPMFLRN